MKAFHVEDHEIGPARPCLLIAEVALAHDGSLGTAHAFIDAVARAGADAVKFQTHIAEAESTAAEPFRVAFSRQDETRYEYWQRTSFSPAQWAGLAAHARDRGLIFLSSPFSEPAVELLERIGMPAWKIGSGEVGNHPLVRRVARTGRPVLLSSGLSPFEELDAAVSIVKASGAPVGVFQCTTRYPCPPEQLGLEQITVLSRRYDCPAGLSDHSGTIFAGLGAVMLGAHMIEVHVTLSREMFGPDMPASLTTDELAELVEGVRFLERALGSTVDKDAAAEGLKELRAIFTKSVVAARPLEAGHTLAEGDLTVKKPGTGIPAARLDELIGRTLRRPVQADAPLAPDDLAPVPSPGPAATRESA